MSSPARKINGIYSHINVVNIVTILWQINRSIIEKIILVHGGSDIAQVPLNRHLFNILSLDLLVILLSSVRCQI